MKFEYYLLLGTYYYTMHLSSYIQGILHFWNIELDNLCKIWTFSINSQYTIINWNINVSLIINWTWIIYSLTIFIFYLPLIRINYLQVHDDTSAHILKEHLKIRISFFIYILLISIFIENLFKNFSYLKVEKEHKWDDYF